MCMFRNLQKTPSRPTGLPIAARARARTGGRRQWQCFPSLSTPYDVQLPWLPCLISPCGSSDAGVTVQWDLSLGYSSAKSHLCPELLPGQLLWRLLPSAVLPAAAQHHCQTSPPAESDKQPAVSVPLNVAASAHTLCSVRMLFCNNVQAGAHACEVTAPPCCASEQHACSLRARVPCAQ